MWLLSLGVQLSVVFRVPGIDIHEAEEVKAQFLSPVLPGEGALSKQGHLARREGLPLGP